MRCSAGAVLCCAVLLDGGLLRACVSRAWPAKSRARCQQGPSDSGPGAEAGWPQTPGSSAVTTAVAALCARGQQPAAERLALVVAARDAEKVEQRRLTEPIVGSEHEPHGTRLYG